jgi:4'-phosphopantetheinyl transferase EntD
MKHISRILPDGVHLHQAPIALIHKEGLFPEECVFIDRAVEKRIAEFATGRYCARQALAQILGTFPSIPVGKMREPIWPAAIVGSITHDGGHCIAVAAERRSVTHIGIDLTENQGLDSDLVRLIRTPGDCINVTSGAVEMDVNRLIFSLKESVYKSLFPEVRKIFDFSDVNVLLDERLSISGVELANKEVFGELAIKLNFRYWVDSRYIFSIAWADRT